MRPSWSISSFSLLLFFAAFTTFFSCKKAVITEYPQEEEQEPVYFENAPYQTLSEYGFFVGPMKDQVAVEGVIPVQPASKLFTDYAKKKRWIWMPEGRSASYSQDGEILDMPEGTMLIKNFYYDNMQPSGETKILETRIMFLRDGEWIFGEYIWNDAQTEAYLDLTGSSRSISWIDENSNLQSTNYRFPSDTECLICHKRDTKAIPIGVKPQNINFDYDYDDGTMNQLDKLISVGYLEPNVPNNILSTVDYSDPTQDLDLRLRSYLDINCAHCHGENSHCDYRPIRLAFSETADPLNIGLCVDPDEFINSALTSIIAPANKDRSVMYFRLSATDENVRMPLLGRSMVHQEGVQLLEDWINAHPDCN